MVIINFIIKVSFLLLLDLDGSLYIHFNTLFIKTITLFKVDL